MYLFQANHHCQAFSHRPALAPSVHEINEMCMNSQCITAGCVRRERWTRAACVLEGRTASIWRGGVSSSLSPELPSLPRSLCPSFPLKADHLHYDKEISIQTSSLFFYQPVSKTSWLCRNNRGEGTCFGLNHTETPFPTSLQPLGLSI